MNLLKKTLIILLVKIYNKKIKAFKLRILIKNLLKNQRIKIKYKDVSFLAGLDSAIESSLLFDDYNEKEILNLIGYFASKKYNLVDVGANIGVHSLIASRANGLIEIFSFEPEPKNYYNFITNISLNGAKNIRPFCMGIGNKKETKFLNINDGWNKGKHSLKIDFGENSKKMVIPISTLNDFKEYLPVEPLILKIDVEGFEKEVLEGANEFFSVIKECLLIIELLEDNNDIKVCEEITLMLKNFEFTNIYKIENENQFVKVEHYQGTSDYIFIKGLNTMNYFKQYML